MLLLTMVNHGWQCFCQPWLTEVPFHKPMVDHGLEKLCQTMVNHGRLWFKKALPNHGQPWLTMVDWPTMVNYGRLLSVFLCLFSVKTPWPSHGQPTRLVQVPSILVENRYKVSLLTWDSFVQTGVQWLHKGKFQSLQTCIKRSICVKPIFLYRHILWCQESKVGSVWNWNN